MNPDEFFAKYKNMSKDNPSWAKIMIDKGNLVCDIHIANPIDGLLLLGAFYTTGEKIIGQLKASGMTEQTIKSSISHQKEIANIQEQTITRDFADEFEKKVFDK